MCLLFARALSFDSYKNTKVIFLYDKQTLLNKDYKELIIDRFEGDFALCEDDNLNMVIINRLLIPSHAREGAVIKIQD